MAPAPITIKEIARLLGISKSTVSRALQERSDVNEHTRAKVMKLARELNYQPNAIAVNLKNKRTFTIGVIIPETTNAFFSRALGGIQKVANAAGYHVVICQSNESYNTEKKTLQSLITNRVDGILVSVSRETEDTGHFITLLQKQIPVVFFDRVCEGLQTGQVITDNYEISLQATQHLIDQGCRRVAMLAGPEHLYTSSRRLKGYRDAMEKNNISPDNDLLVYQDFRPPDLEKFTLELIGNSHTPDGIFAINDMAAIEMMHVIKKSGLRVPDDIAVLGFNNERVSQFIEPSLTSIEMPAQDMGAMAAEMLLQLIGNPDIKAERRVIPSRLIVRNSTLRRDGS